MSYTKYRTRRRGHGRVSSPTYHLTWFGRWPFRPRRVSNENNFKILYNLEQKEK